VLFCGGYTSDMNGTKALALDRHCRARGRAYTRFDYRGHGASDGRFAAGTIGSWLADALAVARRRTIGSSKAAGDQMRGLADARRGSSVGRVGPAAALAQAVAPPYAGLTSTLEGAATFSSAVRER
jgi:hypothetical protein